jgi:hypothetical protein
MLEGLVFGRCKRGGYATATSACDALFSRVRESTNREALSVRLHGDVLRRLRWMLGDYVTLKAGDKDGKQWIVCRVAGPKDGGMKLSRSGDKTSHSATTRFAVDAAVLNQIFKEGERYFTATLCDSTGTDAVFLAD